MTKKTLIAAAVLLICGAFFGCPQTNPAVGRMESSVGDLPASGGESPTADGVAAAEPIDPKTDPKSIGGGTSGETIPGPDGPGQKVSGSALGFGPIEPTAPVDARLRYGSDLILLPKTPAVDYVIFGESKKVALSFVTEGNWDPALADENWKTIGDDWDKKLELRAVFVPADDQQGVVYSDAEESADASGRAVYVFSNLLISEGRLKFFLADAKSPDFHTGALIPLVSGTAANPFPTNAGLTIYKAGAFKVKANVVTKAPQVTPQSDDRWLPLKF